MLVYHLGGAGGTIPEKCRTKCLSMMDGLNVDLGSWTVRIVLRVRVLYFSEQLTSNSCEHHIYLPVLIILILLSCFY